MQRPGIRSARATTRLLFRYTARMAGMLTRCRDWADAFIERWFGLSYPPVHRAVAEAAFAPDSPESWCGRCGGSVGPGEGGPGGCAGCADEPAVADDFVRLGAYDGPMRDWITAGKYEGWSEMLEALGAMLGRSVLSRHSIDPARSIIVPVPMPWQRRMYRGIDHTRVIADAAARAMRLDIACALRKRLEPPRASLTATERRRHRKGWITVRRRSGGWPLTGSTIVLVDDVKTTGTTLRLCARLLRDLGADRVIAAVLAVADERGRRPRPARDGSDDPTAL